MARLLIPVLLLLLGCAGGPNAAAAKPWEKLEKCRLVADPANDGDSFLVSTPQGQHIFRVYFVDAPETTDTGDRTKHQAAYFNISPEQVIAIGKDAVALTTKLLQEPFTVHTRWHKTRDKRRSYCLVTTSKGEPLVERLVAHGLPASTGSGLRCRMGWFLGPTS